MKVEFKKNHSKNADISLLLKELQKIKRLSKDGKVQHEAGFNIRFKSKDVSFIDSSRYNTINSILVKSIIEFNGTISDFSKDQIVKHSLNVIAINNITSEKEALKVLNNQCKDYYKGKRKSSFNLLATLSIDKLPFSILTINEGTVSICDEFNAKFQSSRSSQFTKHYNKTEDSNWTKVLITVEDRDFQDAFQKAYNCLEVLRALLCLQIRSWRFPLTTKSINQVLIGDFLTLHKENGECCDDNFYWYETIKRKVDLYNTEKGELDLLNTQTVRLIDKLNNCNPSHNKTLTNVLCQYVSAYDLVNKESCFLKGWTVLENLLNSHQNETIVKRCVTGYGNPDFLRLQIEALKNYRNELVHEVKSNTDNGSEILNYCYILLNFLIHQISFNLNYSGKISSISEYAEYLDYLNNKEIQMKLDDKFKDFAPKD
jgi:hypothetical protein